MKIKAVANGNVIEADDGAAKELIAAGIYVAYDEKGEKKVKAEAAVPRKTTRKVRHT